MPGQRCLAVTAAALATISLSGCFSSSSRSDEAGPGRGRSMSEAVEAGRTGIPMTPTPRSQPPVSEPPPATSDQRTDHSHRSAADEIVLTTLEVATTVAVNVLLNEDTTTYDPHAYADGDGDMAGAVSLDGGRSFDYQAALALEYGYAPSDEIESFWRYILTPLSLEGESWYVGWYLAGGDVDFTEDQPEAAGFNSEFWFGTGLDVRWYPLPSKVFVAPYLGVRGGFTWLQWEYANVVVLGSDELVRDSLFGLEGAVTAGLQFERNERLTASVEAGFAGVTWDSVTSQEFYNDAVDSFGWISFRGHLGIRF